MEYTDALLFGTFALSGIICYISDLVKENKL